jgi:DNA-binding NarL/FixJ family response regulator
MDIAMPGMNGLEATAQIVRDFPQVKVVILSMNATEEHIMQALRMGASGYILKDAEPSELERAILSVCNGETYLSPVVGTRLAEYVRRLGSRTAPSDRLTPRQREVLQLIAEGWTTKEIAHELKISVKTAETHRTQLMDNLDIHEVAGLVRYAIRTGLISSD